MNKSMIITRTSSIFYGLLLCVQLTVFCQDSLTTETMKPYSYNFDIDNGALKGEGAKILEEAIANAHVTMVGNSLNSKMDADFTNALFNIFNSNDYNNMVLEVGGISGKIINNLTRTSDPVKQFADLNKKYTWKRGGVMTPIPNLRSKEAVEFIKNAAEKEWTLQAVGIESWASYKMLVDEVFANLPKNEQVNYQNLYKKTLKVLDASYGEVEEINIENLVRFMAQLKNSETFVSFLNQMEEMEANTELIYHFRKSIDYWTYYGQRNNFKKNEISIDESRIRLAKLLKANSLDFEKDKFFVKMGITHLSKGIAPNGFYGVGNMLSELTKFNGNNSSLSIGVIPRYYEKEGVVKDHLVESDLYFLGTFKEIVPLGEKETWVLLDLRSFNEKFIYGSTFVGRSLRKIVEGYDMIIIPKTDRDVIINY